MKELICAKPLASVDLPYLSGTGYASMAEKAKKKMLSDSQKKQYSAGNYFEMFSLREGNDVLGFVSLYSKDPGVVSIGLDIREQYRHQGYGTRSADPIAELLAEKRFASIRNTVRTDNEASIRLHKKLGFDCVDRYTTEHGKEVFVFEKPLYICKIASLQEMNDKWDYEIGIHPGEENWITWKAEAINNYRTGRSIPYYGIFAGTIICEATAVVDPGEVQNSAGMIDRKTAYLCAFRTIEKYQGKGYFSRLLRFMLNDLKQKGYTKTVLGVEPGEEKNKAMYAHWGFTEFIKSATEQYPDGTVIDVEYYKKEL